MQKHVCKQDRQAQKVHADLEGGQQVGAVLSKAVYSIYDQHKGAPCALLVLPGRLLHRPRRPALNPTPLHYTAVLATAGGSMTEALCTKHQVDYMNPSEHQS